MGWARRYHPRERGCRVGISDWGRKRTALEWAAIALEEHGRELAQSFVDAAKGGDWRAAEALMNRIYGKPEQAIVARVPPNPAHDVIRSMSLDEKLELLHSLQRRELVELPVIEGSSHRPSTAGNELER